jgi:FAD/FMN-containing dehydrogenase
MDDLEPLLDWLDGLVPELDRVAEPVIAATRLPDLPLYPGVERPAGTVLLLHTTAMCESGDEVARVFAPFDSSPLAGRELGHVRGPTSLAQENEAQTAQNPENHRYVADCTWTDAPANELAPLLRAMWSELPTEHSFSIWYGWAPSGELPDMAFSVEGNVYLATYAIWADPADDEAHRSWVHRHIGGLAERHGKGVYLGDTDFTRRADKFMADANFARLQALRAQWDPHGRFCSYLIDPRAELNAH